MTITNIEEAHTAIKDLKDLIEEGTELGRNADAIRESVVNAIDKAIEIKISLLQ